MLFEKYKQTVAQLALVMAMAFILAFLFFLPASAQYGDGAYGSSTYGDVGASEQQQSGGGLSNTGQALAIAIPAGMVLVGTGILYKISRNKKKRAQDQNQQGPQDPPIQPPQQ